MIVTGALCWWNERPEDLDACIRGLGNVADRVVALDGAYRRYPGATAHSGDDQLAAIREAAAAVNLECRIDQPDDLWAGQVAKRSHLLGLATEGSDWIVTVDADHIVHADREQIRHFLGQTNADVIEVPHSTPFNPDRRTYDAAVGEWHILQAQSETLIPHIWRRMEGMHVESRHWWIAARREGQKVWLWAGDGQYPEVQHQVYRHDYWVEHRTFFRTDEQINASRAFLNDRYRVIDQTGQEDDMPGLPPFEYDYRMVPER